MPNASAHIFVSHSSLDADIADALADLLKTGAGVGTSQIFCTSLEGHGVPEGEDFVEYIRKQIESPQLVVALLSPAYYESVFCLCELGAAWSMEHSLFPLLVPPLTYEQMKGVVGPKQGGHINRPPKLDNLRDRVAKALKIDPEPTALWNKKRDQFLVKLDGLLATRPPPTKVPAEQLNEVTRKYKAALASLSDKEEELGRLQEQFEAVKKLKPKAAVTKVLVKGDEKAEYEELVATAKAAVNKLPAVVQEALFHRYAGTPFRPDDLDRDKWEEIHRAYEDKYLEDPEEGPIEVQVRDRTVHRAIRALDGLGEFLESASETFSTWFADEAGFEADVTSRRFWRKCLEIKRLRAD